MFEKKLPCDLALVLEALKPWRKQLKCIAVESTYNWYWLVDGLQDAGYEVRLANPAKIQQYNGLKHADDRSDAFFLAELLRLEILPTGHICERKWRAVRDLLRRRMRLVSQRTSLLLSVKSLHTRVTGQDLATGWRKALAPEEAGGLFDDPSDRLIAGVQVQLLQHFQTSIDKVEKAALKNVSDLPSYQGLQSLPGVGRILGLTILLETAEPQRFASAGNYASYCRCVDSRRISNGKKKGENNQKCGNKFLSWAFVEAANFARRHDGPCRSFFDRKQAQTNRMVATKALACKLAKAAWHILIQGKPYDAARMFPGQTGGILVVEKKTRDSEVAGAPLGRAGASPLRVATGGDANGGSEGRRRRSPGPAQSTARSG